MRKAERQPCDFHVLHIFQLRTLSTIITSHALKMTAHLEVACFNIKSALNAAAGGAARIELCSDRDSGGITPWLSSVGTVKQNCKLPIFVMIRPRGGNFVYSQAEFEQMKSDIVSLKDIADGFVFGTLDRYNEVDMVRNSQLVALASGLPCTFHRAFDDTLDKYKALECCISCGFKAILTSGGAVDAVAGVDALRGLIEKAMGRIAIMPGGGVRSSNIQMLRLETKSGWFHSSAILDDGQDADVDEIRSLARALLAD